MSTMHHYMKLTILECSSNPVMYPETSSLHLLGSVSKNRVET